jgi:hypothetical protein
MKILKRLNLWFYVLGIFMFMGCANQSEDTNQLPTESVAISITTIPEQEVEIEVVSQTPTSTNTLEPIETEAIISPTAEFLYDKSVLSLNQRETLTIVSQKFLADDEASANIIANNLKFLVNDGHASNMCGPLAIAQLRDAGLLSKNINLPDYWLLEPYQVHFQLLLDNLFPVEDYQRIRIENPINEINYLENPLYTGDYVYLYYGDLGTFEHIFTVTRVDAEGRAYTVTNVFTGTDYLIQEKMLYDPNNVGEGLFYEYTNLKNWNIGYTGFGGLEIWRPTTPILPVEEIISDFWEHMDALLSQNGNDWQVMIKEVGGEVLYNRNAFEKAHPASTIKIPLAVVFMKLLINLEVDDIAEYLRSEGIEGVSFYEILYEMIVNSNENSSYILLKWVQDRVNIRESLNGLAIFQTSLEPRTSTPDDLTKILENLYNGRLLPQAGGEIVLDLMNQYTEKDDYRLGELLPMLTDGMNLYNKSGILLGDKIIVSDIGILETNRGTYILSFIGTSQNVEEEGKYQQMESEIGEAAILFWDTFIEK